MNVVNDMTKRIRILALAIASVFVLGSCLEHSKRDDDNHTPTGLVLGGGGAKAAAEIGALQELERQGVQVDYIVGTSMGAVIGVLYAAGYDADEIWTMWQEEEWLKLFEKESMWQVTGNRSIFGVMNGDVFEQKLNRALADKECHTFDDLEIPFVCIATEIVDEITLAERRLDSGSLARAVRASMTYPAPLVGYQPVYFDGKRLVDGGMMNNLPVNAADSMGAQAIIAVDLETETSDWGVLKKLANKMLRMSGKLNLVQDITDTGWLLQWLTSTVDSDKRSFNRNKDNFPGLIYVHPELHNFTVLSFGAEDAKTMRLRGQDAMRKQERMLNALE